MVADIFISYARSTEREAELVAAACRALGYHVWRDDELPAHRAYGEVIEERLRGSKAVVVIWSADAIKSQWVRAEADAARESGTLVQMTIDGRLPPLPFNQIQCADLTGWSGDTDAAGWRKVAASVAALVHGEPLPADTAPARRATASASGKRASICVLPFLNMSGDAEQEYFSDGISEDIITDLSKVSALSVVAGNTAFTYKNRSIDVKTVARELGVSHVLEGSVRKAGDRVRISAQLIDGRAGDHVWADRYDRQLNDIFAIQDEISTAIVAALKVKLLPTERAAIENRGTQNPDAYDLYLMARQYWITGNKGDRRRDDAVVRICRQATTLDPGYARAWALMALAQTERRFWHGIMEENALPAAERALALDADIAEAHCVRARYLQLDEAVDDANAAMATALRLDPDNWEVNKEVAFLTFAQGRLSDAIPYFEKAAATMDGDFHDSSMLVTCYAGLGDRENAERCARLTVERVEKAIAQDPNNGFALGTGVLSLGVLGDAPRARAWTARAVLIDPDNASMRYNLACGLAHLREFDEVIDLLGPYFANVSVTQLKHSAVDPDLDEVRHDARYQAMVDAALTRLGVDRGELPSHEKAKD